MPLKTRRRNQTLGSGFGRRETVRNGALISSSQGAVSVAAIQKTVSEGHPFHHKWDGQDEGGEFFTERYYIDDTDPRKGHPRFDEYYLPGTPGGTGTIDTYRGPVFPFDPATLNAKVSNVGKNESNDYFLYTLGTEAIAKCKPGEPVANVSTALAEIIREGMPKLVGHSTWAERGRKAGFAKNSAGEYLNLVFGWSPLIAEIKSVAEALVKADEMLFQLERDSGRIVRRGYDFPDERSETTVILQDHVNPYATHIAGLKAGMYLNSDPAAQGTLYKTTTVVKKRWFRGAFTYYLPDSYYSRNKMVRAATKAKVLLGIELTPETVWNLTPWSWAADWFFNAGSVASNISDFAMNGLVLHYGYMMEHTITTDRYTLAGHTLKFVPRELTLSISRETKRRIKATPFGFGLTWDGFTPKQLAITAALGINRLT